MTRPIATYWLRPLPSHDRFNLQLELSDDPGHTELLAVTYDRCLAEIEACKALGYEVRSGLRAALSLIA